MGDRATRRIPLVVMGSICALCTGLHAAEVILMGDSWGVRVGPFVQQALNDNGLSSFTLLNSSVGGSKASQWNAGQVLDIFQLFASNPDVRMVHLIIGGNDLLTTWPSLSTVPSVVDNVIELLEKITMATPVPILLSGYDYLPESVKGADISAQNALLQEYYDQLGTALDNHASLGTQVTLIESLGLMQVAFGVPQAGLPAGDPALPDPELPGPEVAFADPIHLSNSGHTVYAEFLFQEFYSSALLWAGYPIFNEARDVDTGGFMGWLNIFHAQCVWSYGLNSWMYLPEESVDESGAWVYVLR